MSDRMENKKPSSNDDEVKKELDEILGKLTEKEEAETKKTESDKKPEPEEIVERISPPGASETDESEHPEEENVEAILEKITEKEEEEPVEEMGVVQRVINVFTNPQRLFRYLRVKPDVVTPILLVIFISILTSTLIYDIAINDQITRIEQNDQLPDDRKDMIIDQIEASKHGTKRIIYNYLLPPIGVIITFSVVAAIFLFIGNVILGGKTSFKHMLSVYGYSYLVVAIAGTVVKLPLWLAKGTLQLTFSPAVFLSDTQTTLYRLLSAFDVFTLWFLVVFGIGFAIIYRFTQLKGILSVFITWFIYVLISKVLIAGLLSGLVG